MSNLNEIFSDVIKDWRAAESQRMIFGVDTLQTEKAISALTLSLQKVFTTFPRFSYVLKDQKMEIVVKNDKSSPDARSTSNIPVHLPSMPKVFAELKINSLTLIEGVTEDELKALFKAMSSKTEDIDRQDGLKGFLRARNVKHVEVDQMKFQLLRDKEQPTTLSGPAKNTLKNDQAVDDAADASGTKDTGDAKTTEGQGSAGAIKEHALAWENYLGGEFDSEKFVSEHKDLITAGLEHPQQLEKALKQILKKKKEKKKFIDQLKQKLFNVGFPKDSIESLTKKLSAPKKVLVAKDELARLRKIEQEHQKSAGQESGDGSGGSNNHGIDTPSDLINVIKKKLTDEKARSEAILHQMSQGGLVLDKEGKVVSTNKTAQKVLGITDKEIHGKKLQDVLKAHHLLTTVSDWQNETDTYTPKEVKVKALVDETLSIIRESAIVVQDENGRSIGVVSALHSVTQQEELNRRKDDMLDMLGHDLRAPLGVIKQNFDVLISSTDFAKDRSGQQKKFLDSCRNNIERMRKLIEKIMDMRQLETGKIILKKEAVKTNKLLNGAVNSFTEWARNKNIKLEVNVPELPDIDGDPERLYQVITNFVSNALKFTPEGGSILIRGKVIKSNGREFVEISVKDSGMGIDKENLGKIFNKYEQVTQNTLKGVSGLGLGLSICKMIIDLHGGSISVDSELEFGSTFTFQVPTAQKN